MQVQNNTTKPNVVFFLDVDGVLGPHKFTPDHANNFREMVKKLLNGDHFHTYTCKGCNTCSRAQAHLFNKEVVQALEGLIDKIQDVANIHLVISSTWRKKRTIEELKQIFHMHEFSKYIFDKTVDDELPLDECRQHCLAPHTEITIDNYMTECSSSGEKPSEKGLGRFMKRNMACRASQINKWIKEHPGYAGYLILDDIDEHLSANFGENFVSTDHHDVKILNPEDAEKGYGVMLKQLGLS